MLYLAVGRRGHQDSKIEVVDRFKILEKLDNLVVGDNPQILHSNPEYACLPEVDVHNNEEYPHWHHGCKAAPKIALKQIEGKANF